MANSAALLVALAGGGGALSPLLARLGARRSAAQPLAYCKDDEDLVLCLGETEAAARAYAKSRGVEATSFAHPERQRRWLDIDRGGQQDVGHQQRATTEEAVPSSALVAAVDNVLEAAADRERFPGRLHVRTADSEPPQYREAAPVGSARYVFAAAVLAVGGALAGWLAPTIWGALTLLGVVAAGYLFAAVDHDVLMVDLGTFFVATVGCWAAVLVGAGLGFVPWSQVLIGVACVVGWAIAFETANILYRLLRGVDGLGFGDTMIGVVTVGVPAAISGSWVVGVYAVIAAMFLAVIVTVPSLVLGRRRREDAFALGPYLAVGWVMAWGAANWAGVA